MSGAKKRVLLSLQILCLPFGGLLLALGIVGGAHNIHGYSDEASFLIQLVFSRWLIVYGWKASAGSHD